MKKTVCLFMSLILLLSGFGVFSVGAADEEAGGGIADMIYSEETIAASEAALKNFVIEGLPDSFDCSIQELRYYQDGKYWNEIDLMGIDLDFLYSGLGSLIWGELDVFSTDANGNYVMLITRDDIMLAKENLNIYLQRVLYNAYGGLELYSVENAVAIANVIGNMLYPSFEDLQAADNRYLFGNEIPNAMEFFQAVAKLSKLDVLIDNNWLPRGRAFCEPVVNLLGGNYIDIYSEHYSSGYKLGGKMLEGMFAKLFAVGPMQYIFDILNTFTASYEITYREPVLALFSHKLSKILNMGTVQEYNTFNGLLKMMFCDCEPLSGEGCYADSTSHVDHFCPLEFPVERYLSAAEDTDKFIYLYYYLNLCGRYRNNAEVLGGLQEAIFDNDLITDEDKIKLNSIIDGFFFGKFENTINDAIIPIYKENITTAKETLFDRMRNAFMVFLQKIADYFDYWRKIFSGEQNFGSTLT